MNISLILNIASHTHFCPFISETEERLMSYSLPYSTNNLSESSFRSTTVIMTALEDKGVYYGYTQQYTLN